MLSNKQIFCPNNLNPVVPEESGSWITPPTEINNWVSYFGNGTGALPPTNKANDVVLPLYEL